MGKKNKKKSHGERKKPNYKKIFPEDKVNRIEVVIAAEDWRRMLVDMEKRCGAFGSLAGPGKPVDILTESKFKL
ncbi:MAG: hypothetical protein AAGF23_19245, partial [Acidobacteriota bacterium]